MATIVHLNQDQVSRLMKPVNGEGGWQSLVRKLQRQLRGADLGLTVEDVARVRRYREQYGGSGGWQGRLNFDIPEG